MTRPRILIVENEAIIAMELEDRAERLGYVVSRATTGEGAVEAALATRPDVILMDIRLAGAKDGIDAAAEIQASLAVPIVFVTAHADESTRRRAQAGGGARYLTKPFTEQQLRIALDEAIGRR